MRRAQARGGGRSRHARLLLIVAATTAALSAGPASAATTPATIDETAPELKEADKGWTVSLGFTNLGTAQASLAAEPRVPDDGCELTFGKEETPSPTAYLPAARHTKVTVNVPSTCVPEDQKTFSFRATVTSGKTVMPFAPINAEQSDPKPHWGHLWWFVVCFFALALLAVAPFLVWKTSYDAEDDPAPGVFRPRVSHPADEAEQDGGLGTPLPYFGESWTFKDAWVTNVTAGGALLTGIFGATSVVKEILGPEAETAIGLATAGAAIALALIGAGGIVVLTLTTRSGEPTVGGVLAAAVVTLTGAIGQIIVVGLAGRDLATGDLHDWILLPIVLATVLLLGYGWSALSTMLKTGSTKPTPADYGKKPYTETVYAAQLIARALRAHPDIATSAAAPPPGPAVVLGAPSAGRARTRSLLL